MTSSRRVLILTILLLFTLVAAVSAGFTIDRRQDSKYWLPTTTRSCCGNHRFVQRPTPQNRHTPLGSSFQLLLSSNPLHLPRNNVVTFPLLSPSCYYYKYYNTGHLKMWSRDDDELQGTDRFKACIPYMLPLLDGDQFGHYIYLRIPPLGFLHDLWLGPLVDLYNIIPFAGLLFFLALTLGTRGATNLSRNVRFSAQQAALIDVVLVFPELIGSGFDKNDVPQYIVEPSMNFVWYVYMTMVVYSVYSNLVVGKKPDQIPFISNYAERAVGPF